MGPAYNVRCQVYEEWVVIAPDEEHAERLVHEGTDSLESRVQRTVERCEVRPASQTEEE